ncbi:hypothetical protein ZIOFF_028433 [Zingiber officinale]|uniref:Uncharacterized protein n=3 Tax=Magnoliopsida TaxID=3398 RepID=A0A8J5BV21_ZINOF|nr:hypothetical protein ZIOFF_074572 [Zingiber officinale]KAG6510415.1 hypothetical protein ZIOFF_028433 [Zingiber officinale]
MINGSSRRDLILDSQYFCRSIPAGTENPSLSRLCYRGLWGSRNKRALILRWACYLDAFSSYPLRTWLPSVYRGHDNWYTRGPDTSCAGKAQSQSQGTVKLHRVFLSRYPFVEGRSSFSWEYGMGYFRAVAPRTRTLARGISSTPSYPEKARSPCALTHPPWTNLAEEPLGFRGIGFSPMFALLKPTFSLPLRPHLLARANLLAVSAPLPPLSLSGHLGALAGDPGCFPLDDEAYPPSSHWPTLIPLIFFGGSYLVFRVCLDLVPLSRPAPKQCFTPRCPVNCCASTHFGENQLALGSSGISPLTTTHPLILQHQSGAAFIPSLRLAARRLYCSPTTPFSRFRLLPFRSPLLRESLLLSFPLATKMFQFARLSLACPWIQQQFERLTYSGISGSMLIFNSPKHFVACYALPRLWVPSFRLSVSVSAQQSAFAVGVLSDLYAFHRSTGNSLCPYHALRPIIPDNACILCLTAAAGTELADAYSSDTVIASSPRKEVHDPWAFYLHAALLRQAFAHCGKFPTAASRRSLGRVSVPVWLIILSDQLLIIALPGVRSQQYSHPYPITSIPQASYAFSFDHGRGASQNRKTYIGFRDNQARTDDFHHVKVTLYR